MDGAALPLLLSDESQFRITLHKGKSLCPRCDHSELQLSWRLRAVYFQRTG